MTKPTVPAQFLPSALLYYDQYMSDSDVYSLIERSRDARMREDWRAIVAIDADLDGLPASVPPCERAISRVYLADLTWAADEFAKARGAYKQAEDAFRLSSCREDRHNEAAAVYGQGLASHAIGNTEEARHSYSRASMLFRGLRDHWAAEGTNHRFQQCVEICDEIAKLRKQCMDSPIPSAAGAPPARTPGKKDAPSPPTITSVNPERGALDVPVDRFIEITFSEPMDPNSFGEGDYDIRPPIDPKGVSWDSAFRRATIQHGGFVHSETYSVTIKSGRAQKRSAPISPVKWTFTTQGRPDAIIRYTWPCQGDVDVPLQAPLIVQCSRPIQDVTIVSTPELPATRTPRRRMLDGNTVRIDFEAPLEAGTLYEVTVEEIESEAGGGLEIDQRASVPNPWHFQTMSERLERGQDSSQGGLVLIGILLLALLVVGGVALQYWLDWSAVGAYILAWSLGSLVLVSVWRRNYVVFPLSAHEEAIIHRAGQPRVMVGPMLIGWRWPVVERLRAIVPVRPLGFRVPSCQFTNNCQEKISVVIDVRYRVFGSIKAFCGFLEGCEEGKAESPVQRAKDLQAVWEKKLREVIVSEMQKRLRTTRKAELEKDLRGIEAELIQVLNLKAYHWGIEIQSLELRADGEEQ